MKKILFLTTYASPYRVRFFDELGKNSDVTVLFCDGIEKQKHRDASWFVQGDGRAKFVQLSKKVGALRGKDLCIDVITWLKKPFDAIVICGYSSPTMMLAMTYLRLRHIPFYMEVDGGVIRKESIIAYAFKKWLVSRPTWWLSTGEKTTDFLVHYGAKRQNVLVYPFSSLNETDLWENAATPDEKKACREELGMTHKRIVLTIGQFIPRKGFDILLKAAAQMDDDTGIYFVGGQPTEEYLQMQKDLGLQNTHFVGFCQKDLLEKYYRAADVYVMPTREDIWGLVIGEAMACGLPVVTTDRCVAGLELVENGVNGFIVPVEDAQALAQGLKEVLSGDTAAMGARSLEKVRAYTIENMAKTHLEIFSR